MKIILEPADFPESYGPPEHVEKVVNTALNFAYTLEVVQLPRQAGEDRGRVEVTFKNVPRQDAVRLVGPVDVEFVRDLH